MTQNINAKHKTLNSRHDLNENIFILKLEIVPCTYFCKIFSFGVVHTLLPSLKL